MKPAESVLPEARVLRSLFSGPPRWTLAVAESVTCGSLQAAVGAVSGASEFFLGGITAYSLEQKVRHLGVEENEARACNAVSAGVAAQMATGACRLFGSDFAISTTGYAEPNEDFRIKHPLAFWAVARSVGGEPPSVVRQGSLERPGLDRVAMQREVVRETLAAFAASLRGLRQNP